ncbi:hypothetical protein [Bacillus sp. V59.32b]|uniref:hypothetical protein n=1 Tax=Bacillus sp. V59.32b TaxID=1758642 RepID=UPI000E3B8912|nr:hypothetical protein [Bacillus sp. V59.32b]RFU68560.1 hypothetical protein D0463_04630 [Bacillus sp. V59.32b]
MSLKRKQTVIHFSEEEQKQQFLNWALGPSTPSDGVKKAKDVMRIAKAIMQNANDQETTNNTPSANAIPQTVVLKGALGSGRIRLKSKVKILRDGKYGVAANYSRRSRNH